MKNYINTEIHKFLRQIEKHLHFFFSILKVNGSLKKKP